MKQWLICFAFILSVIAVSAENRISFPEPTINRPGIGTDFPARTYPPSTAEQIIQDILDAVGMTASFEIRTANIPNAAAASLKGKKFILYNPAFINALNEATGSNRWAPVSILAHEIGHHLYGHTMVRQSPDPDHELQADIFAGFALRKMGASLEDAQLAIRLAASKRATATHPARNDRLAAIAAGWEKADEELTIASGNRYERRRLPRAQSETTGSRSQTETTESRVQAETQESRIQSESILQYNVSFLADPDGQYHVTKNNNLVKREGNTLLIFGKMFFTDNDRFPGILRTTRRIMLVKKDGSIYSGDGKPLGSLKQAD